VDRICSPYGLSPEQLRGFGEFLRAVLRAGRPGPAQGGTHLEPHQRQTLQVVAIDAMMRLIAYVRARGNNTPLAPALTL
jgi:hypothetical protein